MELHDLPKNDPEPQESCYCCLYLDDATLKAVGVGRAVEEFKAGDEIMMMGVARVRCVSERVDYEGEPRQCLDLDFVSLGLGDAAEADEENEEAKEEKPSLGARMYG